MTMRTILMTAAALATLPALAGCTSPAAGGDADTLEGMSATDFALAGQECPAGQVMDGIDGDGEATCVVDQVGGGAGGDYALAGQSCAVGDFVRAIAADGTVVCGTDQVGGGGGGDYALAGETCPIGQVSRGTAADGTALCVVDDVDGGDADTLDGMDSTEITGLRPIGFGVIDSDGSIISATTGISSTKNGDAYVIGFAGESYIVWDYATLVTAIGSPMIATASSVGGDLIVNLYDHAGNPASERFHFVTYKV